MISPRIHDIHIHCKRQKQLEGRLVGPLGPWSQAAYTSDYSLGVEPSQLSTSYKVKATAVLMYMTGGNTPLNVKVW